MMERYSGSRLYEASSSKLGFPSTYLERTVTVSTTPSAILQVNPRRLSLLIVNHGSTPVYLAFSSAVTTTTGIILAAGGGSVSMTYLEDGELLGAEVWAVASIASASLYIVEGIGQ